MAEQRHFISDNASGVHPEVIAALVEANNGHAVAYGDDAYTKRATALLRKHFGEETEILFALTGTGANIIALQSMLRSYEAVICADCAHLYRDECGAPEKFLGAKLLPVSTQQGKLSVETLAPLLQESRMVHRVQPKVLTVSQCTEWGTVYTPAELTALADFCHDNNLLLHVDGARLCNAAVALGVELKTITADCNIDLLSFGGTKNGLMGAEAIVFFNPEQAQSARFYHKQAMQLCSKMRFIATQFLALLEGDLWQRNAAHANTMATGLANAVADIKDVQVFMPVQTNAVFAIIPPAWVPELQARHTFAVWDQRRSIVRWMTSFDTTPDDIDSFSGEIHKLAYTA